MAGSGWVALKRIGRRVWRGHEDDPVWARPALLSMLAGTAVLYLWNIGVNGWANSYYAAAVQAGSTSWKAFLFGSLDAGNAITVDKPALFLWPMGLAARIFGLNSWSLLVPQALEGVAAVALLAATVRRLDVLADRPDGRVPGRPGAVGHMAGLAAGAMFALTPVATLMFRFDNPDAMLTLLVVAAGYALVRALESASTGWLAGAGALVGLAFITKLGQALLVVPALALVYLVAAPGRPLRRIGQLLVAGLALIASAGWWIALVELWPASARPYTGGSKGNSVLELALGFNGLGRLFGSEAGETAAGGINAIAPLISGSTPGMTRLFTGGPAAEISWLLPAALLSLLAGLWLTRRAPRTHAGRAGVLLFGLWLLVTAAVFSTMEGIFHEYYTIALAPPIAGLVATCGLLLWRERSSVSARAFAAAGILLTAGWDVHLLASNASYLPWLRYAVGATAVLGVAAAAGGLLVRSFRRPLVAAALVAATAGGLSGAGSYAVATVGSAHLGSIPRSGPAGAGLGPWGMLPAVVKPSGGRELPQGRTSQSGEIPSGSGMPSAAGMLGGPSEVDSRLVSMLRATTTTWAAATTAAIAQAPLQLAAGRPVIAVGGFTGDDPAPSLDTFTRMVSQGEIHYFVLSGGLGAVFGARPDDAASSRIEDWVKAHYTPVTVGQVVVYDLTRPAASVS